mmetsp:Transcript_44582/g.100194  ORF Transcript_44582/g.100194 Transcript_44582/m.100194 type:complete len:272 (+) Transcript_44582:2-817(+)|eukprot:CAMPEP_0197931578 /NCGR_PEP_ID=MMETSP1439-20131203/107304_1 /TAXON_ID=66791 /ORGANISM="Gonyaulax spinifera, Strain CCMP409" /LENGTH=271 /DNA_ID=CAMNT_0043554321 /DNA_START=1 /DNA_END=816 /DNA_ORIENTATION=+
MKTGPLRLLRLLRLARMTRLMRSMPELLTMVKGMRVASRAVSSALLMLCLLTYTFAIPMFGTLGKEEALQDNFGSLWMTMWTLVMDGTFMDNTGELMASLMEVGSYHGVLVFMIYVLFASMTMMNMLIGILCEVVSAVAQAEKEEMAITLVKQKLLSQLRRIDVNGDGSLTRTEMRSMLEDHESVKTLCNLKVDVPYLYDLQDMVYGPGVAEHEIATLLELILALRGDRPPTMQDMIDMMTFTRWQLVQALDGVETRLVQKLDSSTTLSVA